MFVTIFHVVMTVDAMEPHQKSLIELCLQLSLTTAARSACGGAKNVGVTTAPCGSSSGSEGAAGPGRSTTTGSEKSGENRSRSRGNSAAGHGDDVATTLNSR